MSILKIINRIRRYIMSVTTKNLLSKHEFKTITNNAKIKYILICRPNSRLGNLLLITPLLLEIENTFPGAKIDLIIKGSLAKPLFKKYQSLETVYELPNRPFKNPVNYLKSTYAVLRKKYDLVINASVDSSSGKIITQNSKADYKTFGAPQLVYWGDEGSFCHAAQKPILAIREMTGSRRKSKIPNLDLKLTHQELETGKNILRSICNNGKKNICIFTYATGEKMHSKLWWNKLYLEMKINLADFNIIEVLPLEKVSQVEFKAPTYFSNKLRELGAVIAASDAFIGADSGITHLASSVKTPTIGLFNVTDENMYGPYHEFSCSMNTNKYDQLDVLSRLKTLLNATEEANNIGLKSGSKTF